MKVTVHVHNGIDYSVNPEGRCDWHSCTHNVYNSFDEPEMVKEVMKVWVAVYYDHLSLGEENDKFLAVTDSKEAAKNAAFPGDELVWVDDSPTQSRAPLTRNEGYKVFETEVQS